MPPRFALLTGFALVLLLTLTARASELRLGWTTAEAMRELPPEERLSVPAWCGGIYHNPLFLDKETNGDTRISADHSRFIPEGLAELTGNIRIDQPGRLIHADNARVDQQSGDFEVEGNILAQSPQFAAVAERMSGNTREREASLFEVDFAIMGSQSSGSARQVDMQDEQFRIRKSRYTTCAPGQKGWSLGARQMDLDREKGWGTARHVVLRVADVPTLYLPWVTFPIDDRRKSGLLFPSFSSTENEGLDVSLPIYLNLHPQADATIALRNIHSRGSGLDNEFRYLTGAGTGRLHYSLLMNDQLFDEKDREHMQWTHYGEQGNWVLESDINYVSDDFYFKDLDSGLDIRAKTQVPRLGQARYRSPQVDFLARLQAWQTIDPTLAEEDKPYRRLPQLRLIAEPKIPGPFALEWTSELTRFERDTDIPTGDINGNRLHLQPAISLPWKRSWGYVVPRVRLYHTHYQLDSETPLTQERPSRTLVGSSLDAGLFLDRRFSFLGHSYLQTLEPRLFYNHIEFENQDGLPDFDSGELTFYYSTLFRENRFTGFDRIGDDHKTAVGITSRIMDPATGRELLRARTGMAHYLDDRQVQTFAGTTDTRARSPVVADITWFFAPNWQLFTETQWNSDANHREQSSLRIGYSDQQRRMLHIGYRYRPESGINQAELAAMWPLHPRLTLIGRTLQDRQGRRSLENLVGLEYRDCCWQVRLLGMRELSDRTGDTQLEAERTFMLQVQMVGLGGLGGQAENLLRRSIPGYHGLR